jgi:hemoglobin
MARTDTIYDAVGGTATFVTLAAAHHRRCLEDPELNHPFSHDGHPQHVERLAAYWAEVLGGPPTFSTTCDGHTGMLGIHAHNGMGDDWGDRFVRCFVDSFDEAGLPDDAELRGALRAYMEWAVVDVLAYSPKESVVPVDAPMPRWSWDGLASSSP